jgi:hypothetical protein
VLDLNLAPGDDRQWQTEEMPEVGDPVVIELAITEGATGLSGIEAIVEFDADQLAFVDYVPGGILLGAFPLNTPGEGEAKISAVILGGTSSKDSGTAGQISLEVLDGFTGETDVRLTMSSFGYPDGTSVPAEIGPGGARVTIGGVIPGPPEPEEPTPDFTGDGKVDFLDFLQFAVNFGKNESDSDYDAKFDLTGDRKVDFLDFLQFAQAYGKPVSKPGVSTKPALGMEVGANAGAQVVLRLEPGGGGEVSAMVGVKDAGEVTGYGAWLEYDGSVMDYVGADAVVSSRVYPYRFVSRGPVQTRRMLLLE